MRTNVRMVSDEVPKMQLERKRRMDQLEREARTDEQASMEMLAYLVTFGLVVTLCLVTWWATSAPEPVVVVVEQGQQ